MKQKYLIVLAWITMMVISCATGGLAKPENRQGQDRPDTSAAQDRPQTPQTPTVDSKTETAAKPSTDSLPIIAWSATLNIICTNVLANTGSAIVFIVLIISLSGIIIYLLNVGFILSYSPYYKRII